MIIEIFLKILYPTKKLKFLKKRFLHQVFFGNLTDKKKDYEVSIPIS